jgi:hypothetical protein
VVEGRDAHVLAGAEAPAFFVDADESSRAAFARARGVDVNAWQVRDRDDGARALASSRATPIHVVDADIDAAVDAVVRVAASAARAP